MEKSRKDPLEIFLYFSIFGVFIGLAASIFFYKNTFSGNISTESADWSALGSFFGGIFAPTVSFVTLMAILITIKIQKKMLETQASEFSNLHKIQIDVLKMQEEQLTHIKSASENEKIATYKQTLLAVVAQQIDVHQKIIDRLTHSAEFMLEKKMEKPGIDLGTKLDETCTQKEDYEKKLNILVNLSITIAITKYLSLSELDKAFATGYANL